ncbi:MAG: hypothetical protein LH618_01335, partial [Saprospiraceae bacterium]|nr:hypothetical protein [Saprospiraceae bacterium]
MKFCLLFLFFSFGFASISQTDAVGSGTLTTKKKGKFYFMWGYTRAAYSKSTIQFKNNSNTYYPETGRYHDYDFTVYEATAHDRADFDKIYDVANIT